MKNISEFYRFFIFILYILLSISHSINAQVLSDSLANQLKKVKAIDSLLLSTQTQERASVSRLRLIKKQVSEKKLLSIHLANELEDLFKILEQTKTKVTELYEELSVLKKEYADMLYQTSKVNPSMQQLVLVFSSESISELGERLFFLEQVAEVQKKQILRIRRLTTELESLLANQQNQQKQRKMLKAMIEAELADMTEQEQKLIKLIRRLSLQRSEIAKELAAERKATKDLEEKFSKIIAEKVPQDPKRPIASKLKLTPKAELVSSSFAENKGKLRWPVDEGILTGHFGKYRHEVLDEMVDNSGIDISTKEGTLAKVIFGGEVIAISNVPKLNQVVLVQHGLYFTMYAKLKSVKVKIGDELVPGQSIGEIFTSAEGYTEVHFEIWKQKIEDNQSKSVKLNPEIWLAH